MITEMNKIISIVLKTPVVKFAIGFIELDPDCVNALEFKMVHSDEIEVDQYSVSFEKWGSAKVICEDWVYLYNVNILNLETLEEQMLFYYVKTGKLYDSSGYLEEILVGEELISDNSVDVFKLFSDKVCECLERG
jgi:hypothetical protein